MRKRLWFVSLITLLAAGLACNLGSPINPRTTPTRPPTLVAVINTSTPNPTMTPTTSSSDSDSGQISPGCIPRGDWPTMTVGQGDTLSGIASRTGTTVDDLVSANCMTDANALIAGQSLRVPVVPVAVVPTSAAIPNCTTQWFFIFTVGADPNCPGPAVTTSAAGENFEGGRVYWYAAVPASSDPRGTLYVIYNDGTWETFVDTWSEGQTTSDPNIVPPPDRYQPVRGIGKLWRENTEVRSRLGWAYEPESAFAGRRQGPTVNTPYIYIDHGWRNLVLRLTSIDNGPNRWIVAGRY
jgi:LysM repeat protein